MCGLMPSTARSGDVPRAAPGSPTNSSKPTSAQAKIATGWPAQPGPASAASSRAERRSSSRRCPDRPALRTAAATSSSTRPDRSAGDGELKKILNHTGMAAHHVFRKNFYMDMAIPLAGCAHQAGTCRFGTDPATSVLDTDCKTHELDNLYVVDTSFFPSIGAVNPALTAIANALRVGDHLRQRMA